MLKRNEGYFLAELLLSLSTWILITCALLPLISLVWKQAYQLTLDNMAIHLLYDELEREIDEGITPGNRIVQLNGANFEISWNEEMPSFEVCVKYEDANANVCQKCRSPEQ